MWSTKINGQHDYAFDTLGFEAIHDVFHHRLRPGDAALVGGGLETQAPGTHAKALLRSGGNQGGGLFHLRAVGTALRRLGNGVGGE